MRTDECIRKNKSIHCDLLAEYYFGIVVCEPKTSKEDTTRGGCAKGDMELHDAAVCGLRTPERHTEVILSL